MHCTLCLLLLPILILLPVSDSAAQSIDEEEEDGLALVYGDKDTVSIATGIRQPLRLAPSVATVITAEDIKASGARDLDEVMESVPGIHVAHSFQSNHSIYQIRGIGVAPSNPQVLTLLNGIQISSLFNGDRGAAMGPPLLENVERIEIIRGPGSALYGADAFSGVINVITKSARDISGTSSGVRLGSFNTRNAWIQHGSQHEALTVAAYLQAGHTDGSTQTIAADAATRLDTIFGNQTSLAPGPMNNRANVVDSQLELVMDNWRLRTGYKQRTDVGIGVGVTSALDPVGKANAHHFNTDLSWKDPQLAPDWSGGWVASYLQHDEDYSYMMYQPGTRMPSVTVNDQTIADLLGVPVGTAVSGVFPNGMLGSPGRWERQFRLSGNLTYGGIENHIFRLGLGHEDLNMYKIRTLKNFWLSPNGTPVPTGDLIDYSGIQPHQLTHRRFNDYIYVQDEWKLARDWALTAGIRHDKFSDFGDTSNPRLALVWNADYDLTAKLMYGHAFRAPSFNEQYGVNPSANGNPNLKPEQIKTMEAALSWLAGDGVILNMNLYRFILHDAIRVVANPSGIGTQFQNTGGLHGQGSEFEISWDATHNMQLTANLALQSTIDESTNQDAGYAPHKHAFARSDWRMAADWILSAQLNHVADRHRIPRDTRPQVPDYTTFDLTLRNTRGNGNWDFSASIRNLFNATVLEPSLYAAAPASVPGYPTSLIPYDLPTAPRTLWLQATYTP